MSSAEHNLFPGQVLVGKYRVERILGEGGMGVVVAAHHLQLDERVALKFLLPSALTNSDALARFGREARAAVKIKSEHVARVTDVGQLENGAPYIVMEYLEGIDLAVWLKERGPLAVDQAVDFILQACEALAEAHSLGIVHRDLKPGNLFCIQRADGQPSLKILDFGISKVTVSGAQDMTRTHSIFGSPQYMSPEQLRASKGVDARTDIWSLGTILFELITGRAPFMAESITELAIVIANEPAPNLSSLRAGLPQGLEHAIFRCLEKDRERRFQTVGEVAVALERFGSKKARISVERVLGTLQKAARPGAEQHSAEASNASVLPKTIVKTAAEWGQTGGAATSSGSGRARIAAIGAAALVVLLVVVGGVLVARQTPKVAPAVGSAPPPSAGATTLSLPEPSLGPIPSVPAHREPVDTTAPPVTADAAVAVSGSAGGSSRAMAPATPSTARPPATSVPSRPSKQADCDPPYYVNDKGSRVFKKECL